MVQEDLSMYVTYNPCTVTAETPLDDLLTLLAETGFQQWPVVDAERRLIGIVHDDDVVAARFGPAAAESSNPRVAHVMRRDPFTVALHNRPQTVLRLLLENDSHSIPVVENERLLGLITRTDFLREFTFGSCSSFRDRLEEYVEVCNDPVEAPTLLTEAVQILAQSQQQFLPVVRGNCPLGVLSAGDLRKARCRYAARDWTVGRVISTEHTVAEIATSCPSLRPSQKLGEAAQLMIDHSVEALAVVNQARRLLGVISEERILRVMHEAMQGQVTATP